MAHFSVPQITAIRPRLSDFIRNTPVQMDRGSIAGRALVEARIVQIPDVKADPELHLFAGAGFG